MTSSRRTNKKFVPPDIQISNLKWRFIIIGMLTIILWTTSRNEDRYLTTFLLIVIWLLILASIGGLSSLRNIIYGRFNYKDQKELK